MTTAQTTLAVALSLVFLPLGPAKIAAVPFIRHAATHLACRRASTASSAPWKSREPPGCCSGRHRPRSGWLSSWWQPLWFTCASATRPCRPCPPPSWP